MKPISALALTFVLALSGCGGSGPALEGETAAPMEQTIAAEETPAAQDVPAVQDIVAAEAVVAPKKAPAPKVAPPAAVTAPAPVAAPAEQPVAAPVVTYTDVTIPAGTILTVQFQDTLSSATSVVGDGFNVLLVQPVVIDGRTAAREGAMVSGTVLDVVSVKKIGGSARMDLDFTTLRLMDGRELPISAVFSGVGPASKKKDAATIGGAAAGGALLGRIIGHKKGDESGGTAIGAVVGGAVGTAIAATNKDTPVVIEQGTVVDLVLDAPVTVSIRN